MDIKLESLIKEIKKNKYTTLSDDLIETEIRLFLQQKPKANNKEIIKYIRSRLHKIYGVFQTKKKKLREQYIKNLNKILETTLSTKERLDIYPDLYKKIFEITGKPKIILDIGSGMNPASYNFFTNNPKYIAIEIDKDDINFLNKFFLTNKIDGKAILMHVNEDNLHKLPKSDITFLFKTLDVLEYRKGHKFAEKLIGVLKTKYIIISFPTKTISNKIMKQPYRIWLEKMLNRLNLSFKTIKYHNEVFYIIKK